MIRETLGFVAVAAVVVAAISALVYTQRKTPEKAAGVALVYSVPAFCLLSCLWGQLGLGGSTPTPTPPAATRVSGPPRGVYCTELALAPAQTESAGQLVRVGLPVGQRVRFEAWLGSVEEDTAHSILVVALKCAPTAVVAPLTVAFPTGRNSRYSFPRPGERLVLEATVRGRAPPPNERLGVLLDNADLMPNDTQVPAQHRDSGPR